MSNMPKRNEWATDAWGMDAISMSLELIVIPVSDADRAKRFYATLGWRLDLDFTAGDDYRVIQFTPPSAACSVMFGRNITAARPGSAQGNYLIVADLTAVRDELLRRGIAVDEPIHDSVGVFHHADGRGVVSGLNPQRQSYASYASFRDPDGNGWVLQEIRARLSADLKLGDARFTRQLLQAIGAKA